MEQPRWLAGAWADLGQREIAGRADNPRIHAYFEDVGASHPDEVPWCAAFVGACLERAGLESTRSLMARSYLGWGAEIGEGKVGAIAVFSRGSDPAAGHVGFLLGETDDSLILLGGNQSDAVTVAAFPKARLLGLRWPQEIVQPEATIAPQEPRPPTPNALFDRALAHVLEMEGGFTDDPYDPGGPTNRGITLRVYAAWKGVAADARLKEQLKHIPEDDVRAIYAARYWTPAQCDALQPALAFFHFDAVVNHGITGATRLLQRAVGTDADGEIGPLTLEAISCLAVEEALDAYADERRKRYRALPHFWRFGRGWLRRVDVTLKRALEVAREPAPAPIPVSEPSPQAQGETDMVSTQTSPTSATKWWGNSVTVWGAIITALSTVLPALGPILGIDITSDLVRELGDQLVLTVQAVGGLVGTVMTIYGRVRASGPLERRDVNVKL